MILSQIFSFISGVLLAALICAIILLRHYRRELKLLIGSESEQEKESLADDRESTTIEKVTEEHNVKIIEPQDEFIQKIEPAQSASLMPREENDFNVQQAEVSPAESSDNSHAAVGAVTLASVTPENDKLSKSERAEERIFQKITDTIRQEELYLDSGFGRQDIVKRFHVTAHRAGMLFSKRQMSIPDFVRSCRLEHACRLMAKHPDYSLSEIASASGFIHLGTFMHAFKNKYGITPTNYRQNIEEERNE